MQQQTEAVTLASASQFNAIAAADRIIARQRLAIKEEFTKLPRSQQDELITELQTIYFSGAHR
jgi:hypothetical protein